MQGQMDLFNPPDMHIVNVCGELREAPSCGAITHYVGKHGRLEARKVFL